jgi:predicted RecA/RadA family phage recombinase
MFIVRKILGGRINVPEPEMHVAGTAIKDGMALTLSGGTLVVAGDTTAPTHIALADAASGEQVSCYAVIPGTMIFEVPVAVAPTGITEGSKLKLNTDGLKITATTGGAAIVVDTNGAAAAGDTVMVKF